MTSVFAILTGIALLVGVNIWIQKPNRSYENVANLVNPSPISDLTIDSFPTVKPLSTEIPTPTLAPSPIVIVNKPQVTDCTGPDGKHLWVTQKVCDDFNNAWKKPTATPVPSQANETKSKKSYKYYPAPHTFCYPNMNGIGQNCSTMWY